MKDKLLNLNTSKKMALAALLLGIIALLIGNPNNKNVIPVNAKELSYSIVIANDKINVVVLADWLIKEKKDFVLVDLRTEKEFSEYCIPGSQNIAIEDLLTSELKRNEKIVLYGANDIAASQAWFILKSSGYKGAFILDGGMNSWKNEILFPKLAINASPEQINAFEKIKQVSLYFGGKPQLISTAGSESIVSQPTSLQVMPKIAAPAGGSSKGAAKKKKEGC